MTRGRLLRELSGDEWAGWVALNNLRAKEQKAAEVKAKKSRPRPRRR